MSTVLMKLPVHSPIRMTLSLGCSSGNPELQEKSTVALTFCCFFAHLCPKNKARGVKGIGQHYFSTNQGITVTWGINISQEAIFAVFPSRIISANSWEREKPEQLPSLFRYIWSLDALGYIRTILGTRSFRGFSDVHAISVTMCWTEISWKVFHQPVTYIYN